LVEFIYFCIKFNILLNQNLKKCERIKPKVKLSGKAVRR
jgi:hypothetical protein